MSGDGGDYSAAETSDRGTTAESTSESTETSSEMTSESTETGSEVTSESTETGSEVTSESTETGPEVVSEKSESGEVNPDNIVSGKADVSRDYDIEEAGAEKDTLSEENIVSEKTAVDKYSDIEKDISESTAGKAEIDKTYDRPSGHRSGVRDTVWDSAKDVHGRVRDPGTGRYMSKDQPWDMGHKPGYEFVKHQESAARRGISRKEFLDEYNNPDIYRPELPSSNRSHKGESKTENYYE